MRVISARHGEMQRCRLKSLRQKKKLFEQWHYLKRSADCDNSEKTMAGSTSVSTSETDSWSPCMFNYTAFCATRYKEQRKEFAENAWSHSGGLQGFCSRCTATLKGFLSLHSPPVKISYFHALFLMSKSMKSRMLFSSCITVAISAFVFFSGVLYGGTCWPLK